jgi:hypothetical protein
MLLNAIRAALRSRGEHIVPIAIVPTAEEPLRAAANDMATGFSLLKHTPDLVAQYRNAGCPTPSYPQAGHSLRRAGR